MLSKNDIKIIGSLQQVKFRRKLGLFVAEGNKVINELIDSGFEINNIFTLDPSKFEDSHPLTQISEKELQQVSFLSHAKDSLALFNLPAEAEIDFDKLRYDYTLALDCIQDPGNLGTIVRIADWFGIDQIICSKDTVDVFNPKVIQATMGSIGRIKIIYTDLKEFIEMNSKITVLATSLSGSNMYESDFPKSGLILLGNESKGVHSELMKLSSHQIKIPGSDRAESLNVAVAAGIICAEIRRQH